MSKGPIPRRRGEVLERAILSAAWDELAEVGYAKLTIEGVAARAQTSKTVIYRRWQTRSRLIIGAMRQEAPILSGELPDTGSLREDVLGLLRRLSKRLRKLGPETVHGLLSELVQVPHILEELDARNRGLRVMRMFVDRAVARGELRGRAFSDRVLTLPLDLVRHEVLITQAVVSDVALTEIVDELFLPALRRR